jgi:hypothetical protein
MNKKGRNGSPLVIFFTMITSQMTEEASIICWSVKRAKHPKPHRFVRRPQICLWIFFVEVSNIKMV